MKEEEKDRMTQQNYTNMKSNRILKNPIFIPYAILIGVFVVACVYFYFKH